MSRPRTFVSHLAVAFTSALAGLLLGGWLAFETAQWRAFKSLIENMAGGALLAAAALAVVAVGLALAANGRITPR